MVCAYMSACKYVSVSAEAWCIALLTYQRRSQFYARVSLASGFLIIPGEHMFQRSNGTYVPTMVRFPG